jgi:circadian clock protein KaiB
MKNPRHHFRLYLIPRARASQEALARVREVCDRTYSPGAYRLDLVDVERERECVAQDDILLVPTLIRLAPGPEVRLIAELSSVDRLTAALRRA